MLKFSIFGFPVQVQPFFWLLAFMLGGGLSMLDSNYSNWLPVLQWMIAIFCSLMVHELGHAFAVRRYGGWPVIVIHTLGGTTFYRQQFERKQRLVISSAGPFFSLILAGLAFVGLNVVPIYLAPIPEFLKGITWIFLWINCIWTAFNLLPVMPMDGGQILRDLLGPRHFRMACIIGIIAAIAIGGVLLYLGWIIAAVLLGIMAYQNYKGMQQGMFS
jgi:stage IV sporulation protein FB